MEAKEKNKKLIGVKRMFGDFFSRRNPLEFFIALMSVSIVFFLFVTIFKGYGHLKSLFFLDGADKFMDFFNSVRDVSFGSSVYLDRKVIYPPMANLIFLFLDTIMPYDYVNTTFENRYEWINYPSAIVVLVVYMIILTAIYFVIYQRETKKFGKLGIILSLFLLLNVPLIHLIERGNIVILSITCSAFFLFNYDSENKVLKELSLISLAFAFSIKLYPAVLGWVLVVKKDYKSILRLIVYALLLLIIPSFFFGGPKCILWMLKNVIEFTKTRNRFDDVTLSNLSKLGISKIFIIVYQNALIIICLLSLAVFLFTSFFINEKWKLVLFACAAFFLIPGVSSLYCWVIFLIPLIMFFKEEKLKGINWIYFFLTVIPFTFIPEIISLDFLQGIPTVNTMATKIISPVLVGVLCFDAILQSVNKIKNKKVESA